MTRINAGIAPELLIDQHLIAELRELPRVFSLVGKRIGNDTYKNVKIPEQFVLGEGHVTFFYDKLWYLQCRFKRLVYEYRSRLNKDWNYPIPCLPAGYYERNALWKPDSQAQSTLKMRIDDRITNMKREPRYIGVTISRKAAIVALRTANVDGILNELENVV